MLEALQTLPSNLHEAFEATFERIRAQHPKRSNIGVSTLLWITQAKRPLYIKELRELFAIRPGSSNLDRTFRPEEPTILESCMGLVSIDSATRTIQLVHAAVFDYLDDHRDQLISGQAASLSLLCLNYLCSSAFAEGPLRDGDDIVQRGRDNKLLCYASMFWNKHLEDDDSTEIAKTLAQFLGSPMLYQSMIQFHQFYIGFRESYWCFEETRSRTAVHLACQFGLVDVLSKYIDQGADINAETAICHTRPIHNAASSENTAVLRTLLAAGPEVGPSNWYGTALHCAAERGRARHITILLSHGLHVDIRDPNFGRTALHCAVQQEHWEVVHTLLLCGADPNVKSLYGKAPIHFLDAPAELTKPTRGSKSNPSGPVFPESTKARKLTQLLNGSGGSGDDWAESWGGMRLLTTPGVDLDVQDKVGCTALHLAAERSDFVLSRLLVGLGASLSVRDMDGITPREVIEQEFTKEQAEMVINAGGQRDSVDIRSSWKLRREQRRESKQEKEREKEEGHEQEQDGG